MNKQKVVYWYSRILLSHRKELTTVTCYKMNGTWKHYITWKKLKTQRTYIIWFYLHEMPQIGKSMEKENN